LALALLVMMIVAAFAIGSSNPPLPAEVKFKPRHLQWTNMGTVRAEIRIYILEPDPDSGNLTEIPIMDRIDNETVVLEPWVTPIDTCVEYTGPTPKRFVALFPGSGVKAVIKMIIDHMGVIPDQDWVPIEVPLTVSGDLKEIYGGDHWEGTGTVMVTVGDVLPPGPSP
jgi:hypothetical protein